MEAASPRELRLTAQGRFPTPCEKILPKANVPFPTAGAGAEAKARYAGGSEQQGTAEEGGRPTADRTWSASPGAEEPQHKETRKSHVCTYSTNQTPNRPNLPLPSPTTNRSANWGTSLRGGGVYLARCSSLTAPGSGNRGRKYRPESRKVPSPLGAPRCRTPRPSPDRPPSDARSASLHVRPTHHGRTVSVLFLYTTGRADFKSKCGKKTAFSSRGRND